MARPFILPRKEDLKIIFFLALPLSLDSQVCIRGRRGRHMLTGAEMETVSVILAGEWRAPLVGS